MTTYTQARTVLDEIAQRSETNRKRLEQAKSLVAQAVSDLQAMQTSYQTIVADVDTRAASGGQVWQLAKAEKDILLTDLQTVRNSAQTLLTALG